MKPRLHNNITETNSTHNEAKFVVAGRFIRTLMKKIYKCMTSISKILNINKLGAIIEKYNNTHHRIIKMKPAVAKLKTCANFDKENDYQDHQFKVGDYVRISKYKDIFSKVYILNRFQEVLEFFTKTSF